MLVAASQGVSADPLVLSVNTIAGDPVVETLGFVAKERLFCSAVVPCAEQDGARIVPSSTAILTTSVDPLLKLATDAAPQPSPKTLNSAAVQL
jgi:hypothetical protein